MKYKWHSVRLLGMAIRNFRDIPKKKKKNSREIAVNNSIEQQGSRNGKGGVLLMRLRRWSPPAAPLGLHCPVQ